MLYLKLRQLIHHSLRVSQNHLLSRRRAGQRGIKVCCDYIIMCLITWCALFKAKTVDLSQSESEPDPSVVQKKGRPKRGKGVR